MSITSTILVILGFMALIALVETLIPLHARGRFGRAHVVPNLGLTLITFATNAILNLGIIAGLVWLQLHGLGLLNVISLPAWGSVAIVLLSLDFAFYVLHVMMHKVPGFWRYHVVHHSDPEVDVTTTIRQHPGEGLLRYAFIAAFAFALGASPTAFAVYRLASAVNGLFEHANVRAPSWLDRTLALCTTWPHAHKVHHSREPAEADSNYGNLFSFWDRIFGTFTPSGVGTTVKCGVQGHDDPVKQTTLGLLALPFRMKKEARAHAISATPAPSPPV